MRWRIWIMTNWFKLHGKFHSFENVWNRIEDYVKAMSAQVSNNVSENNRFQITRFFLISLRHTKRTRRKKISNWHVCNSQQFAMVIYTFPWFETMFFYVEFIRTECNFEFNVKQPILVPNTKKLKSFLNTIYLWMILHLEQWNEKVLLGPTFWLRIIGNRWGIKPFCSNTEELGIPSSTLLPTHNPCVNRVSKNACVSLISMFTSMF